MRGPAPPPWTRGNFQTCQGCGQSGGRRSFCGSCEKPFCKRCQVDGAKGHPPCTARLWKKRRDQARAEEMQLMQMELAGQAAGEALAEETERMRAALAGQVAGEALAGEKKPEARAAAAEAARREAPGERGARGENLADVCTLLFAATPPLGARNLALS